MAQESEARALLHPLVVLNISEHWTRSVAQSGTAVAVYGALIGRQCDKQIEIMNSFELLVADDFTFVDGKIFETRLNQYKEVFKNMDLFGWYSTGWDITDLDRKIREQVCELDENLQNPILLKLNPSGLQQELPLKIYDTAMELVNGRPQIQFNLVKYELVSEDSERIGVDHVARLSSVNAADCSAASLGPSVNSIRMLSTRIHCIVEYLKAVEAGQLAADQELLKDISSLCHRLTLLPQQSFERPFYSQVNELTLMAYLGVMCKCSNVAGQLVNKLQLICSDGGRRHAKAT